jgi:predicted transcriptional regulator of viral defense system
MNFSAKLKYAEYLFRKEVETMREQTKERIMQIAEANGGYLSPKDLRSNKLSTKYIPEMVKNGWLEQIKHGLYRLSDTPIAAFESFIEVMKSLRKAVICCESALAFYNLSTVNPGQIHIAVDRKSNVKLTDWPPVKVHYFTPGLYHTGVDEVEIRGQKVRIYSPEKTLCHCVRYRDQIGIDIAVEALKNYLKKKDRNLSLLMKYAKECGVKDQMKHYLEAMV